MGWFKNIFGGSKRRRSRPIRTYYEERVASPDKPRSTQGSDKDDEHDKTLAKRSAEDNEYSHNHNNGYESGSRYPPYYDNYGEGTWVSYQGNESPNREQHGSWLTDLWNHFSGQPKSGYEGSNSYADPHYGHLGSSSYGYGNPSNYDQGAYGADYYGKQGHSTSEYPTYYGGQGHSTTEYPTYYGEQGHSTTEYPAYDREQVCYICQTSLSHVYCTASHPFWRQPFCAEHELDGTPFCQSCQRHKSSDEKYTSLVDGRLLCPKCRQTSIMDREACKEIYHKAKRFYKRIGMEIESYIPVHMVDSKMMSKISGYSHTSGVTLLSEETVKTIIGVYERDDDVITRTYELDGDGVTKGVLLLYGYPRLMAGLIIAHELMHVWLRLEGYPRLDGEVEEGLAQVMAYQWLCSEIEDLEGGWQKKFGQYLKYFVETNDMPNYSSGFRKGIAAVERYGLKGALNRILSTGEFPW